MNWIAGILGRIALPLCAILLVALLSLWGYYSFNVKLLREDISAKAEQIAKLTNEVAVYKLQALTLTNALKVQNDKVLALVNASITRSQLAEEAIASAKAQAKRWKSQYDRLLHMPPPTKDECESLGVTITQYFELRRAEFTQSK